MSIRISPLLFLQTILIASISLALLWEFKQKLPESVLVIIAAIVGIVVYPMTHIWCLNQALIKATQKAKAWKVKTLSSYALHGLTTTDKVIAKDQREVFDEGFENDLKGYRCDF